MILIADNLTVTNASIAKAIDAMNPGPIQDLVFQCERAGAVPVKNGLNRIVLIR